MNAFVGKIYLAGFHPENNLPLTGEIECFMANDIYLCKAHGGGFSVGTPCRIEEMMEWKFFNNLKELQVYLNARQTAINNQLAKQQQGKADQTKPPRKVNLPEKKSGNKRRTAPTKIKKKEDQTLESIIN